MNILLVDDEILAIKGTLSAVRWKKIGIKETFVAYSMRQAQNIFNKHKIDIMLCDIEMPNGSGLDLLQWVHDRYPETVTLFLTCHSNFTYAQKAIQLGVFHYILKPIPYDELEQQIMKAAEERRRLADNALNAQYKSMWDYNESIVIEKFWMDVLNQNTYENMRRLFKAAEKKNIHMSEKSFFLPVQIRILNFESVLMDWLAEDFDYALRNMIQEIFSTLNSVIFIMTPRKENKLILIQSEVLLEEKSVYNACKKLYQLFEYHFHQKILCCIGKTSYINTLSRTYHNLKQFDDSITNVDYHIYKVDENHIQYKPTFNASSEMKDWELLLESGKVNEFKKAIKEHLHMMQMQKKFNRFYLKRFYYDFTQMLHIVLIEQNILAHCLFCDSEFDKVNLSADMSANDYIQVIYKMVDVACEILRESRESQTVIQKAKNYIQNNLHQDLTREKISNSIFIHVDYLSRLFKREEKISITDYICKQRMQLAKQLLEKTDLTISAVCEKTGYSYSSHFSKTFKRETGLTPLEYRKRSQIYSNEHI